MALRLSIEINPDFHVPVAVSYYTPEIPPILGLPPELCQEGQAAEIEYDILLKGYVPADEESFNNRVIKAYNQYYEDLEGDNYVNKR